MKLKELLKDAERELKEEEVTMAKEAIKERLKEIKAAEKTLQKMKKSLEGLLDRGVDDISLEDDE